MDKEPESVIALSAELAQVKAERDAQRSIKEAEKKILLQEIETSTALRGLCRELAMGLNSLLADQTVHFTALSGLAVGTCVCCRCNALALLSRPEVVKLLEEKS